MIFAARFAIVAAAIFIIACTPRQTDEQRAVTAEPEGQFSQMLPEETLLYEQPADPQTRIAELTIQIDALWTELWAIHGQVTEAQFNADPLHDRIFDLTVEKETLEIALAQGITVEQFREQQQAAEAAWQTELAQIKAQQAAAQAAARPQTAAIPNQPYVARPASYFFPGVPESQIATVTLSSHEDWRNFLWESRTPPLSHQRGYRWEKPHLYLILEGAHYVSSQGGHGSGQFPGIPQGSTVVITGRGRMIIQAWYPMFRLENNQNLIIDGDITLCYEGPPINPGAEFPLVQLSNGSKLELRNGSLINAGYSVVAGNNSNFTMSGGVISGHSGSGVIIRGANASLTMSGGTITGNARGISTIRHTNYVVSMGNGVIVDGGSFTMSGGTISNHRIIGHFVDDFGYNNYTSGGGLSIIGGRFTMTGGSITGNSAPRGGGVSISGESTVNLSGGSISGNTATQGSTWGDAVHIQSDERRTDRYILGPNYVADKFFSHWFRDSAVGTSDRLTFSGPASLPTAVGQTLNGWTKREDTTSRWIEGTVPVDDGAI